MLAIETDRLGHRASGTTRPAFVGRRDRLGRGARSSARVMQQRSRESRMQAAAHRIARALAEIADGLRRGD
jgi:hypothetical protein